VLLRFGIIAVVTCHFSVDALYTAFVMIRSGDPYYVVTGCLSTGVFVVLLLVALGLYVTRGGFLPAHRTNEEEGTAPPLPPQAPREVPLVYRPLPAAMVALALLLAAALGALALVPDREFGDWTDSRSASSGRTKRRRRFCARADSTSRDTRRPPPRTTGRTASQRPTCSATAGSTLPRASIETRSRRRSGAFAGSIPGKAGGVRRLRGSVTGAVLGFSRTLPDDAPGATLEAPAALDVAVKFLKEMGQDPSQGELKEQTQKDEKARRDHTLVLGIPDTGRGEARVRYELVVQGDGRRLVDARRQDPGGVRARALGDDGGS
jgi:hypothetical protein